MHANPGADDPIAATKEAIQAQLQGWEEPAATDTLVHPYPRPTCDRCKIQIVLFMYPQSEVSMA